MLRVGLYRHAVVAIRALCLYAATLIAAPFPGGRLSALVQITCVGLLTSVYKNNMYICSLLLLLCCF